MCNDTSAKILALQDQVHRLKAEVANLTADRDSEIARAGQYQSERDVMLIGFKSLWECTIKYDIEPSTDEAEAINAALALWKKY